MSPINNSSATAARRPDHLSVLEKGLAVIECFDGRVALSVSQVAERTGLSRAAARRCLLTLATLGYATSDGRTYALAPRTLKLGFAYLSNADLPQILGPELERIGGLLSESCSASVLDGVDVLYIARVPAKRIISVDLRVGSRLPAYCNAMGRVLLGALPASSAETVLRQSERIKRTDRTLTAIAPLMTELRRVREQGYSVVHGEYESGLLTIAVPISDVTGIVVAAVNVGAHADRTTPARLVHEVLPVLRGLQAAVRPLLRPRAGSPSPRAARYSEERKSR